jgi:hypothetical protein
VGLRKGFALLLAQLMGEHPSGHRAQWNIIQVLKRKEMPVNLEDVMWGDTSQPQKVNAAPFCLHMAPGTVCSESSVVGAGARERAGELVFNGDAASVWEDGKGLGGDSVVLYLHSLHKSLGSMPSAARKHDSLQMDGGDGCSRERCLTPLHSPLKNGDKGKLYVMWTCHSSEN